MSPKLWTLASRPAGQVQPTATSSMPTPRRWTTRVGTQQDCFPLGTRQRGLRQRIENAGNVQGENFTGRVISPPKFVSNSEHPTLPRLHQLQTFNLSVSSSESSVATELPARDMAPSSNRRKAVAGTIAPIMLHSRSTYTRSTSWLHFILLLQITGLKTNYSDSP